MKVKVGLKAITEWVLRPAVLGRGGWGAGRVGGHSNTVPSILVRHCPPPSKQQLHYTEARAVTSYKCHGNIDIIPTQLYIIDVTSTSDREVPAQTRHWRFSRLSRPDGCLPCVNTISYQRLSIGINIRAPMRQVPGSLLSPHIALPQEVAAPSPKYPLRLPIDCH